MRHRPYGFRPTLRLTALLAAILISLTLWGLFYAAYAMMAWMWLGCLVGFAILALVFYESGDFRNASWPLTILAYAVWPLTVVGVLVYLATGAGKQSDTSARVSDR